MLMNALPFQLIKSKNPGPRGPGFPSSGAEESRTPDLFIANEALYQLSYRPITRPKDIRTQTPGRITRSLIALLLFLIALPNLSACSRSESRSPGPLRVVVTVPPLVGLIQPLLPDGSSITALMAPGKSEHGYEFTPKDLATLGAADVVVYIGLGLEPAVETFLKTHPSPSRQVICFATVADITDPHAGHHHGPGEECDHHVDPHLWLDPDLCLKLVDAASAAVRAAAPLAGVADFNPDSRAADLKARLRTLDAELKTSLAPAAGRAIVTHHNAWQRLADRYGLKVAAVIRGVEGEPTPAAIAAAVDAIRKQNARAVFIEPQFDPQAARRIADAAGVKVGVLDPLGSGDYFEMMRTNANALVSLLAD